MNTNESFHFHARPPLTLHVQRYLTRSTKTSFWRGGVAVLNYYEWSPNLAEILVFKNIFVKKYAYRHARYVFTVIRSTESVIRIYTIKDSQIILCFYIPFDAVAIKTLLSETGMAGASDPVMHVKSIFPLPFVSYQN